MSRNQLGKACFAYDAPYSDSNDLAKRAISSRILKDRASADARNGKYDRYQKALASVVYNFFDKKTGLGVSINEELAEETSN